MKIYYIDKTYTRDYIEKIYNYYKSNKLDYLSKGSYVSVYNINDNTVLKSYLNSKDNTEIINELNILLNKFNIHICKLLCMFKIKDKYFIIQEKITKINIRFKFKYQKKIVLRFFIKLLKINLMFYNNFNFINLDIKTDNCGYDKNNIIKFFDFNLIYKTNDITKKIDLNNVYGYYYLHSLKPILPLNQISYNIAMIILESILSTTECNYYLYYNSNPSITNFKMLIKNNIYIIGNKLAEILFECLDGKINPNDLINKLEDLII